MPLIEDTPSKSGCSAPAARCPTAYGVCYNGYGTPTCTCNTTCNNNARYCTSYYFPNCSSCYGYTRPCTTNIVPNNTTVSKTGSAACGSYTACKTCNASNYGYKSCTSCDQTQYGTACRQCDQTAYVIDDFYDPSVLDYS